MKAAILTPQPKPDFLIVRPSELWLPRALKYALTGVLICALFLPHLGIAISSGFSLSLSLIAVYGLVLTLVAEKYVRISWLSAGLYGGGIVIGGLSLWANGTGGTSISSLWLLAAAYLPFVLVYNDDAIKADLMAYTVKIFGNLAIILAVLACIQFLLQLAVHSDAFMNIGLIVPESIRASGQWNTQIPLSGNLFRANGFFQREPALLSLVMGIAIVTELTQGGRYWRLGALVAAMFLSYSAAGLWVVLAALLVPATRPQALRSGLIVAGGLILWMIIKDTPGILLLSERYYAFEHRGPTGFARFTPVTTLILNELSVSSWAPYIGHGPGSLRQTEALFAKGYHIHDPAWAVLMYEYGVLGLAAVGGLFASAFFRCANTLRLRIALGFAWLIGGGQLLNTDLLVLGFVLATLWPQVLDQQAPRHLRKKGASCPVSCRARLI